MLSDKFESNVVSVGLPVEYWVDVVDEIFRNYSPTTTIAGKDDYKFRDTVFYDMNDFYTYLLLNFFGEVDLLHPGEVNLVEFINGDSRTLGEIIEYWDSVKRVI